MMVCLSNQKKLIKDGLNLFGQYFVQGYIETCDADNTQETYYADDVIHVRSLCCLSSCKLC